MKVIKTLSSGARLVEYEESDPIYSEGWTIGPVTGPKIVSEEAAEEEGDGLVI